MMSKLDFRNDFSDLFWDVEVSHEVGSCSWGKVVFFLCLKGGFRM